MSHFRYGKSLSFKSSIVLFVLTCILPGLSRGQTNNYTLIFSGGLQGYQSAHWFPNSNSFFAQALEIAPNQTDKLTNLYVYNINPENQIEEIRVFNDAPPPKRGPVKRSAFIGKYEERVAGALKWKNGYVDFFCYRANWDQTNQLEERFFTFSITEGGTVKIPNNIGVGETYENYSGLAHAYCPANAPYILLTFRNTPGRNILVKGTSEYLDLVEAYKFDLPIQTISVSEDNSRTIIITGKETEYGFWESEDNINYSELKLPTDDFTIYSEAQISPLNSSIYSYLASNHELRTREQGVLCVVNLDTKQFIKKIDVFRHYQIDNFEQSYHQWDPRRNLLYYLVQDEDENIELWVWNADTNVSSKTSLSEKNLKGISISPDGEYLLVTTNDRTNNLRVYVIS